MSQSDFLQKVTEFHRVFQHPVAPKPTIPTKKRCVLRLALIAEELRELETAVHEKNIVEVADALCDIQYVLCGAILEFGLGKKFNTLFEEVQRSNMSKACNSREEAIQTVNHYREKKGTECYFTKVKNKWLIYREQDDKTLKSIKYSPADLHTILKE